MIKSKSKQQGIFVIIAVFLILVMGSMGLVIVSSYTDQARMSVALMNGMQTLYIAESGLQVAARQLKRNDTSRVLCTALSGSAVTNAAFGGGTFTATSAISTNPIATTLTSNITSTSTTIPVTSTASFAASGMLVLAGEYMYYGSISGNSFVGVARGIQNTTAIAANSGAGISQHQCTITVTSGIPTKASPTYTKVLSGYVNLAYAYIANSTNKKITICPVTATNSLLTCVAYTNSTFNVPFQVIVDSLATYAYVLNNGNNTISVCSLKTNGTLNACTAFSDPSFNFKYSGGRINPAGTYLYAGNFAGNTVSICPISAGALSTCTTSTGNGTFNGPNDVTLTNSFAYVANSSNNTISICPLNADGSLGTCTTSTGNGTLNVAGNLDVNTAQNKLYAANSGNNTLSICPINANGSLGTCTTSTGGGTFNFSSSVTSNLFIANTGYAYITNSGNKTLSICALKSDGTIGTCSAFSDTTFVSNVSAWISYGKII